MTKLNWDRDGPPRPGSGSVEPKALQRPWATPQEQAERAAERVKSKKAQGDHFKKLHEAVKLEPRGIDLERRDALGEKFGLFDEATLARWREIKGCLQGDQAGIP